MVNEEKITCCLRCKKLRWDKGTWVEVDKETVQIIANDLSYSYCNVCADQLYNDLEFENFFD